MTRREKILLQICIAIALVGYSLIYLLLPALKAKNAAVEQGDILDTSKIQMTSVLEASNVEENLEEQERIAKENYNYFYSKLNSYTIDEIINGIIEKSGVTVESLNIGDYGEISADSLKRYTREDKEVSGGDLMLTDDLDTSADTTKEDSSNVTEDGTTTDDNSEDVLLGCSVNIGVKGTEEEIFNLIDSFKKESPCIEIVSTGLSLDERNVEENTVSVSISLLIYGVDKNE